MARLGPLRIGPADKAILPLPTPVSGIGHMRKMEGIGLAPICITSPSTLRISTPLRTNSPYHLSCTVNRRAHHRPHHTDAMGMA